MKKTHTNLIIDIVMYVLMMLIVGIGFLIKYVLLPGYKRNLKYDADVELYFLGLDRHQWGSIHLIVGLLLIALLLLHIILHWKMVVNIYSKMVKSKSIRIISLISMVILTFVLGISPLFIKPEIKVTEVHHIHQQVNPVSHQYPSQIKYDETLLDTTNTIIDHDRLHNHSTIELNGSMTLNEVALKYNIPVQKLSDHLQVPLTAKDEKLGRLKKQYHFHLNDLRTFIED